MTNTTWNPSDKTASITLSGSNLVATASAGSQGVRAAHPQVSGKYYFEITLTTAGSTQAISGIANLNAVLTGIGATATNAVGVLGNTGTIFVGSTNSLISFGVRATGDIIGIAVDLDNSMIWFRIAPSGNWNANASFGPGGTGGVSITSIFNNLTSVRPVWATATNGPAVTANFGDSAFSGAVPSGYTSGWPTSAFANNATVTQLAVEEWGLGAPDAQMTQLFIEEWGSGSLTNRLLMTQLATEQWGVVPHVTGQPQTAITVVT